MGNLQHRKGKSVIQIMQNGTPVANQKVAVHQKQHAFLFGCGAFETLNITDAKTEEERAFNLQRMNEWLEIFNFATLPFYWGRFEPVEGQPQTESLKRAAQWLRERNVTIKGHPLCWHTVCADWLLSKSNEEIIRIQKERIKREVSEFKGLIDMWDVINEVVIMPEFDRYDNAITRICKELGRVQTVKTMFDEAVAYNPDGVFLINDFNTSPRYEKLIDECLEAGVPISVIGIQSHQHQGYWGREKLEDVLARFSRFGLPIHFTENTFISGDLMPPEIVDLNDYQLESWPSTPDGLKRQCENFEEFYRILFEHPLVEAITTWDVADGAWLNAPAGILRTDNSKKPAFDTLKHLIKEEWWTDEELVTDENGFITVEGFLGQYELEIQGTKKEFTLQKESKLAFDI